MFVIVKKGIGAFGHVVNGVIQSRTFKHGPFEVDAEKGAELIRRGIVDAATEDAPAAKKSARTPKKSKNTEGAPALTAAAVE